MQDGIETIKADVVTEGKGKVRITATFTFRFTDRFSEDRTGTFTRMVRDTDEWGQELLAMARDNPIGLARTSGWE